MDHHSRKLHRKLLSKPFLLCIHERLAFALEIEAIELFLWPFLLLVAPLPPLFLCNLAFHGRDYLKVRRFLPTINSIWKATDHRARPAPAPQHTAYEDFNESEVRLRIILANLPDLNNANVREGSKSFGCGDPVKASSAAYTIFATATRSAVCF